MGIARAPGKNGSADYTTPSALVPPQRSARASPGRLVFCPPVGSAMLTIACRTASKSTRQCPVRRGRAESKVCRAFLHVRSSIVCLGCHLLGLDSGLRVRRTTVKRAARLFDTARQIRAGRPAAHPPAPSSEGGPRGNLLFRIGGRRRQRPIGMGFGMAGAPACFNWAPSAARRILRHPRWAPALPRNAHQQSLFGADFASLAPVTQSRPHLSRHPNAACMSPRSCGHVTIRASRGPGGR